MNRFDKLDISLNKYLKLSTFPVAVKLFENTERLNNIKFLKKPEEELKKSINKEDFSFFYKFQSFYQCN